MVNYNSDSSDGEESFTETNVLLGYASQTPTDDTISHLGGHPEWIDPATPPSAALARCKVCHDMMALLLQLHGDLPEYFPGHERRIFVFGCRRKTCRRKDGSIRALRNVKTSEAAKESSRENTKEGKPQKEEKTIIRSSRIGESLFGAKPNSSAGAANPFASNPFSTSTSSSTPANPFAASSSTPKISISNPHCDPEPEKSTIPATLPQTFAAALSLNASPKTFGPVPPPEPWPAVSEQPGPYPTLYLVDADYETLDKVSNNDNSLPRSMDIDDTGEGVSGVQKEDKDAFESSMDNAFQKFADRLAQNPEQVIRYEFRGQPLLYSKTDAVGKLLAPGRNEAHVKVGNASGGRIPRCTNCGAGRAFEVQLTPHAITELETDEMGLDGMDWGTVIVGVCEKDCQSQGVKAGEVGYLDEWVGVQWEELKT